MLLARVGSIWVQPIQIPIFLKMPILIYLYNTNRSATDSDTHIFIFADIQVFYFFDQYRYN